MRTHTADFSSSSPAQLLICKQVCIVAPPPSLSGIRVRAVTKRAETKQRPELRARFQRGIFCSQGVAKSITPSGTLLILRLQIVKVLVEHKQADDKYIKIGSTEINRMNIAKTRSFAFLVCLDACSRVRDWKVLSHILTLRVVGCTSSTQWPAAA